MGAPNDTNRYDKWLWGVRKTTKAEWLNCKCDWCGTLFHTRPYRLKRSVHHFCKDNCKHEWYRQNCNGIKSPRWGVITTPLTKQRMSNSKKGIYDGENNPFYGKTQSQSAKNKISEKLRCKYTGEKSHMWKGGITPLYKSIRDCSKMADWRNAVFKKDNYKDRASGCSPTTKNKLEAHHIIPFHTLLKKYNITSLEQAIKCEYLWDINNGVTMLHHSHVAYHNMWGNDYE